MILKVLIIAATSASLLIPNVGAGPDLLIDPTRPISSTIIREREALLRPIARLELTSVGTLPDLNLQSMSANYPIANEITEEAKLYNRILDLMNKKDLNEAIEQMAKYFDKIPKNKRRDELLYIKPDMFFMAQEVLSTTAFDISIKDYEFAISINQKSPYVPRAFYQIGLGYLRMNFWLECQATMERAIREYPNHPVTPKLYLVLGEQFFLQQKLQSAMDVFKRLIDKFPNSSEAIEAKSRLAGSYVKEASYDKALAVYREAFSKKDNPLAERFEDTFFYGYSLLQMNEFEEAIQVLQRPYNRTPRSKLAPYIPYLMAEATLEIGEVRGAYQLFAETAQNHPKTPAGDMSRLRAADLLFLTNAYDYYPCSIHIYDDVIRTTETAQVEELAALRKGVLFLSMNMSREARRLFSNWVAEHRESKYFTFANEKLRKALEQEIAVLVEREDLLGALSLYLTNETKFLSDFENTPVLLKLAESALDLGARSKAREMFKKIIYLRSDRSGREIALLRLIQILIFEDNLDEATDRLRRFDFAYPESELRWKFQELWGLVFRKKKDLIRAEESFLSSIALGRKQLKDVRDNVNSYLQLSQIYDELNKPNKALEYLEIYANLTAHEDSLRKSTTNSGTIYRVADLHFKVGNYSKALETYEKAININPNGVFYFYGLGRMATCYLRLQAKDKAIEIWKRIADENPSDLWGRIASEKLAVCLQEKKYGFQVLK